MDIKKTFIRLTNYTCPHGQEDQYLRFLPNKTQKDEFGNYFYQIGRSPRTIFTCHLDTVSSSRIKVNHVFDGKFIKTDGKSILGADDKAGLTVMLYMIHNQVPGLYYFFIGEEVGCVGSKKASKKTSYFNKQNFDRMISFDRRDTHSVITYQSGSRCCSDKFGDALASEFNRNGMNMRKDDTGVYTDSAEFVDTIPECTNISVGYYSEHTSNERQDIEHLKNLCEASIGVNWEKLPTSRNPGVKEYKSYGYGSYDYGWAGDYGYDSRYDHGQMGRNNHGDRHNTSFSELMDEEDFRRLSNKKKEKRWQDEDGDFNDSELLDNYGVVGKVYMDNSQGILTRLDKSDTNWFKSIRYKYLDDQLSDAEIDIIKRQALDMNDPDDIAFAKELDSIKSIKNFQF